MERRARAEIEAIEVRLFLEALHARYGYDLRGYSESSMRRLVRAALARSGRAHLGHLQHDVLRDPGCFRAVLANLMVRVSELFRDPECFLALRTLVVPVLRTYPLIRVWHAGCANGEEVYSTAILLAEHGLHERAEIFATDLSPDALEQARRATYSAEHLGAFAANYRASGGTEDIGRYYDVTPGGFTIAESLRDNITFLEHDLVSDQVFGEMQLVFCRNVLIYFGPDLRRRVIAKLAASLCPGGFLGLGADERLTGVPKVETFAEFGDSGRVYRKNG